MNTRSGGGAAAASLVVYLQPLSAFGVPDGRGRAWRRQLSGDQSGRDAGLGRLRANAADRPDQRGATGRSKVWLAEFAELWRRKRGAAGLQPAGAAGSRRLPSGREADGQTQDAELRSGRHALDGLGRPKGAGRGAAPSFLNRPSSLEAARSAGKGLINFCPKGFDGFDFKALRAGRSRPSHRTPWAVVSARQRRPRQTSRAAPNGFISQKY